MSNSSIGPKDMTLLDAATVRQSVDSAIYITGNSDSHGQSGPANNGNEGVRNIPQSCTLLKP